MNFIFLIFFTFRINLNSFLYPYEVDEKKYYPIYTYLNFSLEDVYLKGFSLNFSGNNYYENDISKFKIFGFNLNYQKEKYSFKFGRNFIYEGASSFIDGALLTLFLKKINLSVYGGKKALLPFEAKDVLLKDNPYIFGALIKFSLNNFSFSTFYNKDEAGISFKLNRYLVPFVSIVYNFKEKTIERFELSSNLILKRKIFLNLKYYLESPFLRPLEYLKEILPLKNNQRFLLSLSFNGLKFFTPSLFYRINYYSEKRDFVYLILRNKFLSLGGGYGKLGERREVLYYLEFFYPYKNLLFKLSFKTFDDSGLIYKLSSLILGFEYKFSSFLKFTSELRAYKNVLYEKDIRGFFGIKFNYEK